MPEVPVSGWVKTDTALNGLNTVAGYTSLAVTVYFGYRRDMA